MEWLGPLGAYLLIGFSLCAGTLIALGTGIENEAVRREAARFAVLAPIWPLMLVWLMIRGIRSAWGETGWGKR